MPEGGLDGPTAGPEVPVKTDIALVFGAPPRDLFGRVVPACVLASVQRAVFKSPLLLSLPGTPTDFGGPEPPINIMLIVYRISI